tara:strand:- start:40 stop:474 length:435 start_codon:yes stop_codon:yes gene_type:complete
MLVYGTANPVGYGNADYTGIYLTNGDIQKITPEMMGVPVKIEHKGADVGKVVSSWVHNGRMELLLDIDGQNIESQFGREFVKRGMCKDLSLGYKVQMSRSSETGMLCATNKRVVEVSLVKVGAREDCHIHGWDSNVKPSHHIVI